MNQRSRHPALTTERWPYVGYKGGGIRGVYSLAWLLRRDDDRTFVVVLGFNDHSGAEIDRRKANAVAWNIFEFLYAEDRQTTRIGPARDHD